MDDYWVVAFDVEDADLEQRPVCCWADEHGQVVIQRDSSHSVANGMPYVRVGDTVPMCWLADPHLDNIACLTRSDRRLRAAPCRSMRGLRHARRRAACQPASRLKRPEGWGRELEAIRQGLPQSLSPCSTVLSSCPTVHWRVNPRRGIAGPPSARLHSQGMPGRGARAPTRCRGHSPRRTSVPVRPGR